jgi:hypothetical protein
MTLPEYGPQELKQAITSSRVLLPTALDLLCEVITEVTGRAPERDCVEYVSSFWLLHACDRIVFVRDHGDGVSPEIVEPRWFSVRSHRAEILGLFGGRRAPITVSDPYFKSSFGDQVRAAARLRRQFRWQSVAEPALPARDIERSRRASIAGIHPTAIVSLTDLRQVIAMTAPVGLVEQHHELAQWARDGVDERIRACYTANAHQSSLAYRHHLYAQRAVGSKIAIHQHGGGYGIDEDHLGEFHDIDRSDVFFTWGWNRPELGARVRVMPTAPPAHAKGKRSDTTLLMSLPVTNEFYRFQPFVFPTHVKRAVSATVGFAGSLSEHIQLRLRSSSAGLFPLDDLRGAHAKITVDDLSEPGTVAASRARLVVHNYLGTSWLETLAMNVPTVCFYDPGLYEPRESARPYFDMLARVGILHHSGHDAAKFVNGFRGDPSSWWNSAEVQEAREAFVARYANFSDNWLEAWQTEFESLLSE